MDPDAFERQAVSLAQVILSLPPEQRVELETTHHFSPGVYTRTMKAPAGSIIIGHKHHTEFLNIVEKGVIQVCGNGDTVTLMEGDKVTSRAGIRKVGLAMTDVVWTTVHENPTNERDIDKLEAQLCDLDSAKVIYYQEREMFERLFGLNTIEYKGDQKP
jgi:hypothetical protein